MAKAYLGLRNYHVAWTQFYKIVDRIEVDGIAIDAVISPYFYNSLCEYWLAVGDLQRAREQATRLYEMTAPPPNHNYLALAHRLLTMIALAEGDLQEAKAQLSRAIAIVEHGEFPLAAWRVYATAAQLHERLGETAKVAGFQRRSEKVIQTLAANFDQDDPLRSSLLAGFAAEISHSQSAS